MELSDLDTLVISMGIGLFGKKYKKKNLYVLSQRNHLPGAVQMDLEIQVTNEAQGLLLFDRLNTGNMLKRRHYQIGNE